MSSPEFDLSKSGKGRLVSNQGLIRSPPESLMASSTDQDRSGICKKCLSAFVTAGRSRVAKTWSTRDWAEDLMEDLDES